MNWKNIKGAGYYSIEQNLPKADLIVVTRDFLNKFVVEFAKNSASYIEFCNEAVFNYGEKQIHTTIAPILSSLSDAYLFEVPVTRKWSNLKRFDYEDSHGWCDYWCSYRGVDFFIEIKHSYMSYKTSSVTVKAKHDWKVARNQLSVIRKDLKNHTMINSKGAVSISINISTVYGAVKTNTDNVKVFKREQFEKSVENSFRVLTPKPNWSSIWQLSDNLLEKCSFNKSDKVVYYYPAIIFVGKVSSIK